MTPRRQQILSTAADLFAARGFHGVSMGDIGAAVGVSGPALYKHFAGKEDILGQCLLHASDQLLAGARELLSDGGARSAVGRPGDAGADGAAATDAPDAALVALIARHADFALDNPALIVIQEREWGALGTEARAQVRKHQLAYIEVWADALRPLRPDLDPAEARAAVQAAFGLLNSTPHSARIGRDTMRSLLTRMARAALLS
ncbi:TetR family transcriptional regulator [Promicromonospora sp. AC04]|uniref:TetR/AcrR family transcriptional regulator n=1 Tax=Promicromonospora sp. AC04 TaxID=2135723 RepID=UPI000D3798B0|nr:TetR/AcrR family transcriptional regulator [Promicromonospora sp. AC04]PUB23420.1 TetR family transcriptional regulator [Promicromonospora sp. AC04]